MTADENLLLKEIRELRTLVEELEKVILHPKMVINVNKPDLDLSKIPLGPIKKMDDQGYAAVDESDDIDKQYEIIYIDQEQSAKLKEEPRFIHAKQPQVEGELGKIGKIGNNSYVLEGVESGAKPVEDSWKLVAVVKDCFTDPRSYQILCRPLTPGPLRRIEFYLSFDDKLTDLTPEVTTIADMKRLMPNSLFNVLPEDKN